MRKLAITSLLLFSFAACGGSSKSADEPAVEDNSAALAEETRKDPVGVSLRTLPADARIVGGVSIVRAIRSKLGSKYLETIRNNPPERLTEIKTGCDIDFLGGAVESAVFSLVDPNKEESMFIAVVSEIGRAKLEACVKKLGGAIATTGKLVKYTVDGADTVLHWARPNLLVFGGGEAPTEQTFAPVLSGGAGAGSSAELAPLVAKTRTTAVAWAAGVLPPEVAQAAQGARTFYAFIDGDDAVEIEVGVGFDSEQAAGQMKALVEESLGEAALFLGAAAAAIKIEQRGAELIARANLTEEMILDLQRQLAPLLNMSASAAAEEPPVSNR